MLKLFRYSLSPRNPLLEIQLETAANVKFFSSRFKSGKQCTSAKGNKNEPKMCGPAKGGKSGKEKSMCSSVKGEKGDKDKPMCGPSKGNKGEKEKEASCSKDKESEKAASGEMCQSVKGGGSDDEDTKSDFPRIGINGFGRIGRMVMRIAAEYSCPLEIVAVNDPQMKAEYMAYLLKYDSTHGRFVTDVDVDGGQILIDGKPVCTYQESEPKNVPWKDLGVDYVIESSGKFTTAEKSQGHLDAGAKHVVVSAPCKDDSPTFVVGVNLDVYEPSMKVVSAASCATNALAPLAKVVHENFEIIEGLMTTVHAVTASQKILDTPSQKNWRESRGGLQNMIPTYTGAAAALGKVLPELDGKMTAISIRVPTPNVSLIDLTIRTKKSACIDDITKALSEASDGDMLGVIDVATEEVVSTDFNGSHFSCIYDSKASLALNKNFFKLIAWFDNEYGYTCRVIDLIKFMHASQ